MSIADLPEQERPCQKLLRQGSEALSHAELLALLFCHSDSEHSVLSVARALLAHYGGLHGLFNADVSTLMDEHGISLAQCAQLQAAKELHRRYLQESILRQGMLSSTTEAKKFLLASLKGCTREIFGCLLLDTCNQVIRFEKLFLGTIDRASIYPREVVKCALQYNASSIIVAHNHPSGSHTPSDADKATTHQLQQSLSLVDVKLIDHIIVAHNHAVSLAELGVL